MAHTAASLDGKGEELLAVERRFEAALLLSDVVALEGILAEGFFLNDFMGGVISRNELLKYLQSGALKFRVIVPHDVSVQSFSVTGIVSGWTEMKAELLGVVSEVKSRFLHVYVGSPQSWRMVAGQGAVIPELDS
jgi:uncharacterized protein DUF4440